MFKNMICGSIAAAFVLTSSGLIAQETPIIIPNMQGEMTIDGVLDETMWENARELDLNYVTRPFENTAPPVTTKVRVIENSEVLFVAFEAQDPDPDAISAFYRDRDRVWNNDLVGVKLDTFNDGRLAYQFFVNPLGVQTDAIENEMTGRESDSWDAIWQSAGRITDTGYVVELAIPLRILNFKEGEEDKLWGAEFVRFYPREERLRISNRPFDRNNSCTLCQLSDTTGFKGAKQSENLAVVPTLVMGRTRSRELPNGDWDYASNEEIGLDVTWGITPEVSMQATLNPDFSQVESDVAQLSINNTFALFFDERRPFFLENADYFSSNLNLVYTRNIGAPDYGAKVTGRIDNHSVGLFVANDESTTFVVPGNSGSSVAQLEDSSTNMALRYRYDASQDFSVGVVSTLRTAGDYHNYVFGVDSKYQITDQDSLRVQVVRSDTQYPLGFSEEFSDELALRTDREDNFGGTAWRVNYRHNQRDWFARVDHYSNGEDFRADLGFVNRVDSSTSVIGGGYRWFNQDGWWNEITLSGDWDIRHNDDGELLEKEAEMYLGVDGKYQSFFEIGGYTRDRVGLRQDTSNLRIDGNAELFQESAMSMFFRIRPMPSFEFSNYMRYGDQIDFSNNRLGKQLQIQPRVELSLGRHFQLNLRHTYRNLEVDDQELFTANLTDARLTYQFDERQFLRLILVYSDIERNVDNYIAFAPGDVTPSYRDLGVQLLYSYKVNPLTKFFVGYSEAGFEDDVVTSLTT